MLKFTVPSVPPHVNTYVRHTRDGRHYVTKEARSFKDAVYVIVQGRHVQAKRFHVSLRVVLGKGDRGDVDGFPKLCMDGMADAGVFRDLKGKPLSDAHVRSLMVIVDADTRPERGHTEFEVMAI